MKIKPSYKELAKQVNELETELKQIKGKTEIPSWPFELSNVIDHLNAVSVKDENGVYVLINKPFTDKFGLTENDILGKTDYDLLSKAEADLYRKEDLLVLETGEPIQRENELFWGGNKYFFILQKFLIPSTEGGAVFVGVVSIDITERKQTEVVLMENEMRLRLSMSAAKAGSWIWDIESDEVVWDDRMQEIFGFEPGTYDGTYESWKNAVHPDDIEEADRQTVDALTRGTDYDFQYRLNIESEKGRWRTVRAQAVVFSNEKGERIRMAGFCVDITRQKKVEEDKEKLESQLQQAQKMEAIGTLAGGIAHDFNNILGAILGYAEMAKDDSPAGSTVVKDLDKVLEAGNRAKGVVQQILSFSRQDETEGVLLQPASIVKEAIKMLRPSLPTTIEINQNIDSKNGLIFADPTKIHQILMNLCTNAFHAMEETGGKLDISLKEVTLNSEDLVNEPYIADGTFIQISICDSGPGISPAIKDKIFDPYFTTKETGKGTGMGLAIIHGIVKSYGGFISFYSEPGEGTAFHVFLPVIEKEPLPETKVAEQIPMGKERILFVDDERILAEMGKNMLERLGYHVTARNSSLDALEIFQNQPDQFDLVITDQTMPGMTGADLARRMIQIHPDIPIILCTGYSNIISEEKAKAMGIREFALKPLTKKDIAVLIRKALEKNQT